MDGSALMVAFQAIQDFNIDFGAVEGSVSLVELPWEAEFVERLLERGLSFVPEFDVSEIFDRPRGEFQLELKSEQLVNVLEEVEASEHLLHQLVGLAEDVSVVLLETPDSRESVKRSANLVSVKNSEVSETEGQVSVRTDGAVEHQTMPGAVHGLHTETLVLRLEQEDVVFVVGVMTRDLPQLNVEHVG